MDQDSLSRYVERSQDLIKNSPQMDEQNTRRKIIEPFLEILGWDMLTKEVELEYPVTMGSGTKKVDYALMLEETPVVFVEAKGVDSTVTDSHRDQLRSYLRQTGVNWGLLTNGKEFEVLKRKTGGTRPEEISLGTFPLGELPQKTRILQALFRDSIDTGESEEIAKQIESSRRAANKLRQNKERISSQIIQLITDEIGESVSQTIEDGAKQFIDVLAVTLEEQEKEEIPFTPETVPKGSKSTSSGSGWTPSEGANAVQGTISRNQLSGDDDDLVAVFPSKKSGVPFLKENNAWGFVRIGQNPDYVAMYVSEDVQKVKYVARVKDMVSPENADLARPLDFYSESASEDEQAGFDPSKKVVVFEEGSLYELSDPIPFKNEWIQSLRYTTLGEFKRAESTDDIF